MKLRSIRTYVFCIKIQSRIDKHLIGYDLIEHYSKCQQYIQENSYEISPKEVAVIGFINKYGHGRFKRWDLRGNDTDDKNARQNICKCSQHVPSNSLHNRPKAAAWWRLERGTNDEEHNCLANCCIWSNLDSWVVLAPNNNIPPYSATGCTKAR